MKIKKGQYVRTPRFCTVKIERVFSSMENAYKRGYTEPTYYNDRVYGVLGRNIDLNHMDFAAYKR